jgi:nitrogen fixation/metabolism regulation signal transduction histidine kinase
MKTKKMKTKISMLVALLFSVSIAAIAQQQGGWKRQTVEERVKSAMDKMTGTLQLDTAEQSKTSTVFTDFYTAQDKMREDARASGTRPDRSVIEKMTSDRDDKLKAIFTDDQYKKFVSDVEPTLHPQRPQGIPGTGGNNN